MVRHNSQPEGYPDVPGFVPGSELDYTHRAAISHAEQAGYAHGRPLTTRYDEEGRITTDYWPATQNRETGGDELGVAYQAAYQQAKEDGFPSGKPVTARYATDEDGGRRIVIDYFPNSTN